MGTILHKHFSNILISIITLPNKHKKSLKLFLLLSKARAQNFPKSKIRIQTENHSGLHHPHFVAVVWIRIRIRRIRMFLGLLDPDPDPLVRGTAPDLDPSIIMKK